MGSQVEPSTGGLTAPVDAADIADGSVSSTEFQYLDGVTSDLQTQLASKVDISGTPSAGNYARWTDADTLEARTTAQVLSDISAAPTASPTFTGTPSAPSLTIAGTAAPPAGTVRAIASDGNANDLSYNALAWHTFKIGGVYKVELSTAYVRLTDNAIIMAGSPAFPGGGHRAIHGGGGTTEFHYNVPTGGNHIFEVNGTEVAALGADVDLKPNGTSRLKLNSDGTVTVHATTAASLAAALGSTAVVVAAYKTTDTTGLAADTYNKITFDTERLDTNSAFASSTFTAPSTGKYRIDLNLRAGDNGATREGMVVLYVDAARVSTTARYASHTDNKAFSHSSWILSLTSGQTVEVYMQHEDGANGYINGIETLTGDSNTGCTELLIAYLGA